MYSEGLKPLALVEQGGEERGEKDGGRGVGVPGDGEDEIEENRRVHLTTPPEPSLEQLQDPFIVRTLPPSVPPSSLIVSPPRSQIVHLPQQVQPVYVIHPKP
jgi:hypothetical protein